ncbi:hypothetical protein HD806DRAFT_512296 [Xylariaceae sp. AK1471]|nr:hypothetical protein HD806DRAFT_512296 [Xylariaceae sp. AK1471]
MEISFGLGNSLTLKQAESVLKAIELGYTFWDTAVWKWQLLSIHENRLTYKLRLCTKPV